MNKICVIYPSVSSDSAKELAEAMGWDAVNPFKEDRRDFRNYVGVFNYGCNRKIYANNVINKAKSVATCINKVATFEAFKKAGIPTVAYTTKRDEVPKDWDIVVVRESLEGNRAKGLDYFYQMPGLQHLNNGPLQQGALYSEFFDHECELRINVFCGKVVGCYEKVDNNGTWDFVGHNPSPKLEKHAIEAAKALDIDYVGFDVLLALNGSYVFLEANSGPILVEDTTTAIKGYFK